MKTHTHGPQIIHRTVESGDVQSFDLSASNFNADALMVIPQMTNRAIHDFRLRVEPRPNILRFWVVWHGVEITQNEVRIDGENVRLDTHVVSAAPREIMSMAADLEQCAAIALLNIEVKR